MRDRAWLLLLLLSLAACSTGSADTAKLTLRNTVWDHVNVQVVISKSSNCEPGNPDMISTQSFVMHIDQLKTVTAPNDANICWRHDRYPNNPHPGEWSGWSKAIPFPGNDTTTDL